MRHLINREDYILEYLRAKKNINGIVEKDNSDELNEGLLGTLFGGLKMLLKKDWNNIKCKNPSVLDYLKDIDKSLAGYTMIKMQYSGECATIRQNVADYFNDILDYKLSQIENLDKEEDADKFIEKENKEKEKNEEQLKGVAKILNLKDKTLLDNIKKYKENIAASCKPDPKLREYADQMLNSVTVFVNDIIIDELKKKGASEAKLEEERKKVEEEEKKLEEIRDKMNKEAQKAGEEGLKKISDERDKALRNIGVKPIDATSGDGDKVIDVITKQFGDMMKEFNNGKLNESNVSDILKDITDVLKSDTYIGIQHSIEKIKFDYTNKDEVANNKFLIKSILNKINTVFEVILKNKQIFKGVPSASVQAMMVSLSNAIIYGFVGDKFDIKKSNNPVLTLLTKCAIDSDATIGFNLPLIDPKKPDNGNFFVSIMNQFKSENISSNEVEDAVKTMNDKELKKISKKYKIDSNEKSEVAKKLSPIIMKDFRQNMSTLFDLIVKKAKDLKEKTEKEREAKSANTQQQSEAEENQE